MNVFSSSGTEEILNYDNLDDWLRPGRRWRKMRNSRQHITGMLQKLTLITPKFNIVNIFMLWHNRTAHLSVK